MRAAPPDGPVELVPTGPVDAIFTAPASKSVTNRLLVLAALAEGTSMLHGVLRSDDTDAMTAGVRALGATVRGLGGDLEVGGTGGELLAPERPVDCRLSGTTLRFLTAVATLAPAPVVVTGDEGLRRRPVGGLTGALRQLGAEVRDEDGRPPVRVDGGGLAGGLVRVDAGASSQFASAVLMVAPYARSAVELVAEHLGAASYVDLTAAAMRAFGAQVEGPSGNVWRIPGRPRYRAREVSVEGDWSAALHLAAFAVATGGRVTVRGLGPGSLQPDAGALEVLARMGASVSVGADGLKVAGPPVLTPVEADLSAFPDQVATIAVLAALAPGISRLTGAGVTRGHETDRLAAVATELGRLGVRAVEQADGLVIRGGTASGGVLVRTYADHRMAMAFAALGARVEGVVIEAPSCVAKTYPTFWSDLESQGVAWRRAPDGRQ